MKKIMLAMATYNRKEALKITIRSLLQVDELESVDLWIFDDCSTEYDLKELAEMVPFAKKIIRRDKNLRADRNMFQMHMDFIHSNYDVLLQVDSDVIFNRNFIKMAKRICSNEAKVLACSLYNSNNHNYIGSLNEIEIDGVVFKEKQTIGGVCVIFMDKRSLSDILMDIPEDRKSFAYDWYWSTELQKRNTPVYVSEKSFIQHIGVEGQNNKGVKGIDIGFNFIPTNEDDLLFLLAHYESVIDNFAKQNEKYFFIRREGFIAKKIIELYRFLKFVKRKIYSPLKNKLSLCIMW